MRRPLREAAAGGGSLLPAGPLLLLRAAAADGAVLLSPPPLQAPLGPAEGVEEHGLNPGEGSQHAAEPRVHVGLQDRDRADLGAREQRLHVE